MTSRRSRLLWYLAIWGAIFLAIGIWIWVWSFSWFRGPPALIYVAPFLLVGTVFLIIGILGKARDRPAKVRAPT